MVIHSLVTNPCFIHKWVLNKPGWYAQGYTCPRRLIHNGKSNLSTEKAALYYYY